MVLNIAHRGARSLAPENTLAAARKALEVGADMWELDVAVTSDEVLIVFHDDALVRTTDAEKRFPDRAPWKYPSFTADEIRMLDTGGPFLETDPFEQIAAGAVPAEEREALRGEKVPLLTEALAFTIESRWRVNVELKYLPDPIKDFPIADRVLDAVEEAGIGPDRLVISSFHHPWLRRVMKRRPDIPVQALVGYSHTDPVDWGTLEFDTYNVRSVVTSPEEVRSVVDKGKKVNLFTVNEVDEMRRYIDAGAAGLITDFPQRLAKLRS